ncbi:F-box protein CPR1-like [Argentina anserina]|uniref:F-box protein CPR1-like n=1 Tax=Argentina anserina TaxID=57926 RepID=UPI00217678F5|nr:F-box protein CPR1-like [Potentilla anserina]
MAEHIPEEVVIKVLERLPVKPLIRFTCVSKRWRFIILSDPQFAKSQYKLSKGYQPGRRLLLTSPDHRQFYSLDFESSLGDNVVKRKVRIPFKSLEVQCSCNGLVCATVKVDVSKAAKPAFHVYIWNPSTGFYKKLPDPSLKRVHGIGYLSATDDYKILMSGQQMNCQITQILSLRANVWKTIQCPFDDLDRCSKWIRVNEALHWLRNAVIVAFNLAIEDFRTMPLPAALEFKYLDNEGSINLAASVGGCLCAFHCPSFFRGSIDMWVMKEYGVADSWTKLFNFQVPNRPEKIYRFGWLEVWDSRIIFARTERRDDGIMREYQVMSVHHQEDKQETHHTICEVMRFIHIAYDESLFWLPS